MTSSKGMKPEQEYSDAIVFPNRLADFLSPLNLPMEDKVKRTLAGLVAIFTCPLLIGFAIFNLWAQRFLLSGVLLLTGLVIFSSVFLGKIRHDTKNFNRSCLAIMGFLFIFFIGSGEAHSRHFFWAFIFPVEALLLLERKEGFLVSIVFDVIVAVLILSHNFGMLDGDYDIRLTLQYLISLLLITLIAYCFEILRFQYQEAIKRRQAGLEVANARLQQEMKKRKTMERAASDALSELKETQSQLVQSAKLASIGELVSGVAHELNQPLMVVRANAQLLDRSLKKESSLSGHPLESLALVQANTKRMMTIINHLHTFSREAKEAFTSVDVNKAIEACLLMVGEQLRLRNIDFQLDLQINLPEVKGNGVRLEQVFLNLLTNARDAIEDGEEWADRTRIIKVSTVVFRKEREWVEIRVKDTGTGISDKNSDRIFEPFFTTKEVGKGTGLGLSISYGIIKEHQGEIEVVETGPEGTTFQIRLPVF
jgi:signal transduction histidine kinase